jgi:hypothetical protein
MLLAVKETVWSNMRNSLHQNLPTQIAKALSNLEIMQYQYPASNQYWKTATEPLRFWLLKNRLVKQAKFSSPKLAHSYCQSVQQFKNCAVPILGQ